MSRIHVERGVYAAAAFVWVGAFRSKKTPLRDWAPQQPKGRVPRLASVAVVLVLGLQLCLALRVLAQPTPASPPPPSDHALLLVIEGSVEVTRADTDAWRPGKTNQVLETADRLRTGERSRAAVRLSDQSVLRLSEMTTIEIRAPTADSQKPGLDLKRGLLFFFSRERPRQLRWSTPAASGSVRGTEFTLGVEPDGRTTLALLEGAVDLTNAHGGLELQSGEQATIGPGEAPRKTALLEAASLVQWCLYYPGVIDVDELDLDEASRAAISDSLAAWRSGDVLQALAQYPSSRQPASASERAYTAALTLAVGQVDKAEQTLSGLETPAAHALRQVIAATKYQSWPRTAPPILASEWLAESYYQQSRFELKEALRAAQAATERSPQFGFAWERLAELEFCFGRLSAAETALARSLELAPRNAQAWALRGFLALARDQPKTALPAFEQAMALDGALGNAWLGRGLCRLRLRQLDAGLADLETAAALEPNRSLLRSYLGKAYQHTASYFRNFGRRDELLAKAERELTLARQKDPEDPTPWLYAALLNYQRRRPAEAIEDLERSVQLNDNRSLYRSRLLLDQDQAVRSANLANLYHSAGMAEVGRRESARAVMHDYANYSAHLNLAGSFDVLRDPARFNLRYESEWFNEHLLATLLSPVEGSSLSHHLSQQEYSRLFVADRVGGASTTEYFSTGEVREQASHFGMFKQAGYAFDLDHQYKTGVRPNNDLSRIEWYSRLKYQLSPQDSVLLLTKYQDFSAGDQFQYYDPSKADPDYRFSVLQAPLLLAGYHHEWRSGIHTLFLAGRLSDEVRARNAAANQILLQPKLAPVQIPFDLAYEKEFVGYTTELNQIFQGERHTDVVGLRFQTGGFDARGVLSNPPAPGPLFWPQPLVSRGDGDFERLSAYLYHTWAIRENLLVTLGGAFDRVVSPLNFRRAPLTPGEHAEEQWSPKAALTWTLRPEITVRAAYARALGGVSYDESVRLEPTQLAGFSQSYRSLISESLAGGVEAPAYELWGMGLDLKLSSRTYVTLEGLTLRQEVDQLSGAIYLDQFVKPVVTKLASFAENLAYREQSLKLTLNQVLQRNWFFETQYKYTRSTLDRRQALTTIPPAYDRIVAEQSDLDEVKVSLLFSPPSGIFSRAESTWYFQDNQSNAAVRPGDSFPQVNLWIGYQFPLHRGEIAVGLLNLTGEDYRLYPLNYYWEMPRERVLYARLKWNF